MSASDLKKHLKQLSRDRFLGPPTDRFKDQRRNRCGLPNAAFYPHDVRRIAQERLDTWRLPKRVIQGVVRGVHANNGIFMVEQTASLLGRGLGEKQCRCRHHGAVAPLVTS
jgi:hypothetical protein